MLGAPTSSRNDESDPDDDLEHESTTTEEAMAYLTEVRKERQMLPPLSTANARGQIHHDPDGDATCTADHFQRHPDQDTDRGVRGTGGYYLDDGGYVGAPTSTPAAEDDPTDPQKALTNALKQRFLTHRTQIGRAHV